MRAARIMDGKPVISEKVFQEQVRKAAIINGWRYYHTWSSMHSAQGFPDICMVRDKRLIFCELKSAKGKVTVEQEAWLKSLACIPNVEVYTLRPDDFDDFYERLK
jgi:hypothetical protein